MPLYVTFKNNLSDLEEVNPFEIANMSGHVSFCGKFSDNSKAKEMINMVQGTLLSCGGIQKEQVLLMFIENDYLIGFNTKILKDIVLRDYSTYKNLEKEEAFYIGSSKNWNEDKPNRSPTPVDNVTYIEFKSQMVESIKLTVNQGLIDSVCNEEETDAVSDVVSVTQ